MKKIKTFNEFLSEAGGSTLEGREKHSGISYQIWNEPEKGFYIKGSDFESSNIFRNGAYFENYAKVKEHAESIIDGYLEEGVDHGKEVQVNEGAVKQIFTSRDAIIIELDHQCNQAQILRNDLKNVISAQELKAYDKTLTKLRAAILDFQHSIG